MFMAGMALPIRDIYIYYKINEKDDQEEIKLVDS